MLGSNALIENIYSPNNPNLGNMNTNSNDRKGRKSVMFNSVDDNSNSLSRRTKSDFGSLRRSSTRDLRRSQSISQENTTPRSTSARTYFKPWLPGASFTAVLPRSSKTSSESPNLPPWRGTRKVTPPKYEKASMPVISEDDLRQFERDASKQPSIPWKSASKQEFRSSISGLLLTEDFDTPLSTTSYYGDGKKSVRSTADELDGWVGTEESGQRSATMQARRSQHGLDFSGSPPLSPISDGNDRVTSKLKRRNTTAVAMSSKEISSIFQKDWSPENHFLFRSRRANEFFGNSLDGSSSDSSDCFCSKCTHSPRNNKTTNSVGNNVDDCITQSNKQINLDNQTVDTVDRDCKLERKHHREKDKSLRSIQHSDSRESIDKHRISNNDAHPDISKTYNRRERRLETTGLVKDWAQLTSRTNMIINDSELGLSTDSSNESNNLQQSSSPRFINNRIQHKTPLVVKSVPSVDFAWGGEDTSNGSECEILNRNYINPKCNDIGFTNEHPATSSSKSINDNYSSNLKKHSLYSEHHSNRITRSQSPPSSSNFVPSGHPNSSFRLSNSPALTSSGYGRQGFGFLPSPLMNDSLKISPEMWGADEASSGLSLEGKLSTIPQLANSSQMQVDFFNEKEQKQELSPISNSGDGKTPLHKLDTLVRNHVSIIDSVISNSHPSKPVLPSLNSNSCSFPINTVADPSSSDCPAFDFNMMQTSHGLAIETLEHGSPSSTRLPVTPSLAKFYASPKNSPLQMILDLNDNNSSLIDSQNHFLAQHSNPTSISMNSKSFTGSTGQQGLNADGTPPNDVNPSSSSVKFYPRTQMSPVISQRMERNISLPPPLPDSVSQLASSSHQQLNGFSPSHPLTSQDLSSRNSFLLPATERVLNHSPKSNHSSFFPCSEGNIFGILSLNDSNAVTRQQELFEPRNYSLVAKDKIEFNPSFIPSQNFISFPKSVSLTANEPSRESNVMSPAPMDLKNINLVPNAYEIRQQAQPSISPGYPDLENKSTQTVGLTFSKQKDPAMQKGNYERNLASSKKPVQHAISNRNSKLIKKETFLQPTLQITKNTKIQTQKKTSFTGAQQKPISDSGASKKSPPMRLIKQKETTLVKESRNNQNPVSVVIVSDSIDFAPKGVDTFSSHALSNSIASFEIMRCNLHEMNSNESIIQRTVSSPVIFDSFASPIINTQFNSFSYQNNQVEDLSFLMSHPPASARYGSDNGNPSSYSYSSLSKDTSLKLKSGVLISPPLSSKHQLLIPQTRKMDENYIDQVENKPALTSAPPYLLRPPSPQPPLSMTSYYPRDATSSKMFMPSLRSLMPSISDINTSLYVNKMSTDVASSLHNGYTNSVIVKNNLKPFSVLFQESMHDSQFTTEKSTNLGFSKNVTVVSFSNSPTPSVGQVSRHSNKNKASTLFPQSTQLFCKYHQKGNRNHFLKNSTKSLKLNCLPKSKNASASACCIPTKFDNNPITNSVIKSSGISNESQRSSSQHSHQFPTYIPNNNTTYNNWRCCSDSVPVPSTELKESHSEMYRCEDTMEDKNDKSRIRKSPRSFCIL